MSMSVSSVGSSYSFIDRMVMNTMNRPPKPQGKEFDPSQLAAQIISKKDTNGDGVLSIDETGLSSDIFGKVDTDGDGKVTSDEIVAGLESNRMRPMEPNERMRPMQPPDSSQLASRIIEQDDANGDSVLSVDETGLSSEEFSKLDTDGDGKVTIDELLAGIKAREEERAAEMASMSQQQGLDSVSGTDDVFQALMSMLAKNDASNAYDSQNWLYQMLQSTSQNLELSA